MGLDADTGMAGFAFPYFVAGLKFYINMLEWPVSLVHCHEKHSMSIDVDGCVCRITIGDFYPEGWRYLPNVLPALQSPALTGLFLWATNAIWQISNVQIRSYIVIVICL